jgi:4'-phosphopantetheinyl transferase
MSEGWIEPQGWPALGNAEVHVWLAHLPTVRHRLAHLDALLSAEERERARRFRLAEHRERSQMARGLLRQLLGKYAGCDPREFAFVSNPHGKPELPDCALHFNTSHSGDYAAFAFTRAGAAGVDIEQIRGDMTRREEIARKYFAETELVHLQSLSEPERQRAFFDLWTCKEAFVKARGDGLFSGLSEFEIHLHEPRIGSVNRGVAADWWLNLLPEIHGYCGAVVVRTPSCMARFFHYMVGNHS